MAKKPTSVKATVKPDCETCANHYDPHEIGANGRPFLCRCKYDNRRSHFLRRDGCTDHYKPK